MEVPISSLRYVYGDNMSVIHNTSMPKLTFSEKEQLHLLSCSQRASCNERIIVQAYLKYEHYVVPSNKGFP